MGYATARYGHVMFPENVYEPALECAELLLEGVGKGLSFNPCPWLLACLVISLVNLRAGVFILSDSPKMWPHPCSILQKYTIFEVSDTHQSIILKSPSNIAYC